jgi:hypothetical protein
MFTTFERRAVLVETFVYIKKPVDLLNWHGARSMGEAHEELDR